MRDARERAQQAQRIRGVEEAEDGAGVLGAGIGRAEEERDRHVERLADAHQPSGADAIDALLVFLHLLERHAEQVAELGLRHALGHAPRADALADLDIMRIGAFGLRFRARSCATSPPTGVSRSAGYQVWVVRPRFDYRELEFAHRWVARGRVGYPGGKILKDQQIW